MLSRAEVIAKIFKKAKASDRILYLESIGLYALARQEKEGIWLSNKQFLSLAILQELQEKKLQGKMAIAAAATLLTFENSKII